LIGIKIAHELDDRIELLPIEDLKTDEMQVDRMGVICRIDEVPDFSTAQSWPDGSQAHPTSAR
jgi:hypothetical protein